MHRVTPSVIESTQQNETEKIPPTYFAITKNAVRHGLPHDDVIDEKRFQLTKSIKISSNSNSHDGCRAVKNRFNSRSLLLIRIFRTFASLSVSASDRANKSGYLKLKSCLACSDRIRRTKDWLILDQPEIPLSACQEYLAPRIFNRPAENVRPNGKRAAQYSARVGFLRICEMWKAVGLN